MPTIEAFEQWRAHHRADQSFGLAWFLANEICQRFYASHGIVPWVIEKEGMGYYGIALHRLPCSVHGTLKTSGDAIGRLTMSGNVENWDTGNPGDHALDTITMCDSGASVDQLLNATIRHLQLSVTPHKSHLHCRHKRWGDSYKLCFEIAASIALKHEGSVSIANHPSQTARITRNVDPDPHMKEHPGSFVLLANDQVLILRGDGLLLGDHTHSIWSEYLQGCNVHTLASRIEHQLGLDAPRTEREENDSASTPTPAQITQLLEYLPCFAPPIEIDTGEVKSTEPSPEGIRTFPYVEYSDTVRDFFALLERPPWSDGEYDPFRLQTKIGDRDFINSADLPMLKQLLRYCCRGENFSTGHWQVMIDNGTVYCLLNRLSTIANA